ncbi:hypothetical protein GGS23DRAFT_597970 [Durotheca rogersii]|uniref:uncharacterized protein n=1 Tax=Durotheca rogersii TaxID=419775 RepID=UPI002220ECB9|nr:uncharacterized protein GGS23DRAFT_597970 [Durotheca rogersii]KAI5861950.1 hypothetical protein GGS23DRAFT_597970 [Durotheca rogersii]
MGERLGHRFTHDSGLRLDHTGNHTSGRDSINHRTRPRTSAASPTAPQTAENTVGIYYYLANQPKGLPATAKSIAYDSQKGCQRQLPVNKIVKRHERSSRFNNGSTAPALLQLRALDDQGAAQLLGSEPAVNARLLPSQPNRPGAELNGEAVPADVPRYHCASSAAWNRPAGECFDSPASASRCRRCARGHSRTPIHPMVVRPARRVIAAQITDPRSNATYELRTALRELLDHYLS